MLMAQAENILVVQTSFLGDVVLTTPLLAELRRRFPDARLSVLCTPGGGDILAGNPDVDEIILLEKRRDGGRRSGLWQKAGELRARRFTLAISPHKSFRTALLLFFAGIPRRIGFRQSAGWFLYHRRVDRDAGRHDVERNLSLLGGLGESPPERGCAPRVEATSAAREKVAALFRSLGVSGDGPIFGVNPGSVWPTKRWTEDGYAQLIGDLKRKYGGSVVLFGGPGDRATVERILSLSNHAAVSLVGSVGLGELAAAVERCDVFITNDSGPMHVAVARRVPVVAIFCATTPALGFYPYASKAVVVEKNLPCRPCAAHGGRRCPLGTEDCMRLIKAEDVLLGVERLLAGGTGRRVAPADAYLPQSIVV
jgi:heptosyltransferase-2